jgi:hypothetical protein
VHSCFFHGESTLRLRVNGQQCKSLFTTLLFPPPFTAFEVTDFSSWAVNFCIPFADRFGVHHVRCASPYEILRSFSFLEDQHIDDILRSGFSDYVLSGLSSGLPFVTANVFARHIFDLGAFPCSCQPFLTAEDIVHCAPAFCLHYSPKAPPSLSDWLSAYHDDPETMLLLQMLSVEPMQTTWNHSKLQKVHPQFQEPLCNGTIAIFQHRLVL